MTAFRRPLALVLVITFLIACTRAVDVPLTQTPGEAVEHKGRHCIRLVDGTEYRADRFTVNDSTVVIAYLDMSDERFKTAELPITLALRDVQSIERIKTRGWVTDALVLTGIAVVTCAIILYIADASFGSLGNN